MGGAPALALLLVLGVFFFAPDTPQHTQLAHKHTAKLTVRPQPATHQNVFSTPPTRRMEIYHLPNPRVLRTFRTRSEQTRRPRPPNTRLTPRNRDPAHQPDEPQFARHRPEPHTEPVPRPTNHRTDSQPQRTPRRLRPTPGFGFGVTTTHQNNLQVTSTRTRRPPRRKRPRAARTTATGARSGPENGDTQETGRAGGVLAEWSEGPGRGNFCIFGGAAARPVAERSTHPACPARFLLVPVLRPDSCTSTGLRAARGLFRRGGLRVRVSAQPSTPLHPAPGQPSSPLHPAPSQPSRPLHPAPAQPSTPLHPAPGQPSSPLHPAPGQPSTPQHPATAQPSSPLHHRGATNADRKHKASKAPRNRADVGQSYPAARRCTSLSE